MHATLTQEPPIHRRSTTAVRRPDCAMCQATSLPPVPLPSTRTSNRSGWDMRIPFARRTLMDNICAQTAVPYLVQFAHYYVLIANHNRGKAAPWTVAPNGLPEY